MATRIRSIDALQSFSSRKQSLRVPKSAAHKAPDYVVLHEPQLRSKKVGGKTVSVKVPARDIYPEPSVINPNTICQMGKGKKELRAGCHVEFVLLGEKHATKAGVKPGAYLRFCTRVGQTDAPLRRVRDHQDALKTSKEYCACAKAEGAASCARRIAGGGNGNGGRAADVKRRRR